MTTDLPRPVARKIEYIMLNLTSYQMTSTSDCMTGFAYRGPPSVDELCHCQFDKIKNILNIVFMLVYSKRNSCMTVRLESNITNTASRQ
jgi:hypothetical protein